MRKLRLCNIYPDAEVVGRNDGNPLYMTVTLRKMGHEVLHAMPRGDLRRSGKFDLYLWCDWGEDALNWPPFECPKPNAYWVSDTHLGFDYRLGKAREFDHVFCAQKKAAEDFRREGIKNAYWLPHAVEPTAYYPHPWVKKYDVVFVGNVNNEGRAEYLDRLFKEFPNWYFGKHLFEEAAEKFCQGKIVFNHAIKEDVNMRLFEVLATGSFLLTQCVPTLEELFTDGSHLATYHDVDSMVETARYYLERPELREKIAEAGYKEVLAKHTFKHRAEEILRKCGLTEEAKEKLSVS